MNFNAGGTGATSTIVTINDLVTDAALTLPTYQGGINSEYVLIQGDSGISGTMATGTAYDDNGVLLSVGAGTLSSNVTPLGQQILGGLSLLAPTNVNYFSEEYQGGQLYLNGDDIVLAVPEPGTWALMLGGFGLLVFFQRRKRNQD